MLADISYNESCSDSYARGAYTIGKSIVEETIQKITVLVEECDYLDGFLIIHSGSGGTGAGFPCILLDRLKVKFYKTLECLFSSSKNPHLIFS